MDRRRFVTSLGAITLPAVGTAKAWAAAVSPVPESAAERSRFSLNGRWERRVNGAVIDHVEVPVSLPPSGTYTLTRTVLMPKLTAQQRAFVHFEAVNYHGRVLVNGTEVGSTLPYVPADFDVTPTVRDGTNTIAVVITDLGTEPAGAAADAVWFGLTPGWEGCGGIIRDAWLEVRSAAHLENVRLVSQLNPQYTAATCQVTAWISATAAGAGAGRCVIALLQGNTVVAQAEQAVEIVPGISSVEAALTVAHPALWSPDTPNLYTLRVTLHSPAGGDDWSTRTGIRDFTIGERTFLLNGEPLQLNGVCRHDLWKAQGMTLTRAQVAQDLRAIKALGANFVRLVHYPHDRYVVELADELGLLVSEESGYSEVDFSALSAGRVDLGLRVLEQVIRRDWNSPSVFAWFLADKSTVTADFVRAGKTRVRALDLQGRFVSAAGYTFSDGEQPAGLSQLDFYERGTAGGEAPDKPMIDTAWTGVMPGLTDHHMMVVVNQLIAASKSGRLAGHCFYPWQDLPQFSRIAPENNAGILYAGVVTEGREPRGLLVQELTRLFHRQNEPGSPYFDSPAIGPIMEPLRQAPWLPQAKITPVNLTPVVAADGGAELGGGIDQAFVKWNPQAFEILGVRIPVPFVNGSARPVVIHSASPVAIPVGQQCTRLHFLGQVQLGGGFPLEGKAGDEVATYHLRYRGGRTRDISIRAGFEVAAANTIAASSRINPVATAAQRVFRYYADWESAIYHGLLFSLPIEPGVIESIRCQVKSEQRPLLLFAVLAEST